MNDNTEYWKQLLGDDYNDELMEIINGRSKTDNQAQRPASARPQPSPPEAEEVDGSRFYNYNASTPGTVPGRNTPAPRQPVAPRPPVSAADAAKSDRSDKTGKSNKANQEDDFDVTFDFEGEYRDLPDNRPVKPRRAKRSGCLGGLLYAVFIICVCLLLAAVLWLAATDILGLGNNDKQVQVTIPDGYTVSSVADTLYDGGLIKYKLLFKLYADFSHASDKITAGTYELNDNYDYRALVNGMTTHGGKRSEVSVVIPEGYTLKQIFELFAANNVCTEEELWDAAANYDFEYDFLDKTTIGDKHRLEGYLFPDTYKFYVGDTATRAIDKMLANFKTKFTDEFKARAEALGYTEHEIIIIAAMIEEEAGADAERDLIASVIYNRLNSSNFPHLQIDATIIYAIAETGEEFSTDIDSPYNTYQVKGLPAGPIANPGINSIRAALYPEKTGYYFYALNKNKTHDFFKDADAFNAFVYSDSYGG